MNKKLTIFFKFLDLAFHVADIYSDIATTALYYQSCQMTFFYLSLAIFFSSYLTTVIYLKYFFYYKSTWTEAMGYPLKTLNVLMKKLFLTIFCKYDLGMICKWNQNHVGVFGKVLSFELLTHFGVCLLFHEYMYVSKVLELKVCICHVCLLFRWPDFCQIF